MVWRWGRQIDQSPAPMGRGNQCIIPGQSVITYRLFVAIAIPLCEADELFGETPTPRIAAIRPHKDRLSAEDGPFLIERHGSTPVLKDQGAWTLGLGHSACSEEVLLSASKTSGRSTDVVLSFARSNHGPEDAVSEVSEGDSCRLHSQRPGDDESLIKMMRAITTGIQRLFDMMPRSIRLFPVGTERHRQRVRIDPQISLYAPVSSSEFAFMCGI